MRGDESLTVLGSPDASLPSTACAVLLADPRTFPPSTGSWSCPTRCCPVCRWSAGWPPASLRGGPTWLCQDGQAFDGGAVGVLIGGDVEVATVVSQGCRPIGPTMIVTSSPDGNELLELAGKPLAEKLQDIITELDPEERRLALTGLPDRHRDGRVRGASYERGDFPIRGWPGSILGPRLWWWSATWSTSAARCASVVRRRCRRARRTRCGAHPVPGVTRARRGGALLFSCNGRGASMFASADHDPLMLAENLGAAAVAGYFIAGGEIGPVGGRN